MSSKHQLSLTSDFKLSTVKEAAQPSALGTVFLHLCFGISYVRMFGAKVGLTERSCGNANSSASPRLCEGTYLDLRRKMEPEKIIINTYHTGKTDVRSEMKF